MKCLPTLFAFLLIMLLAACRGAPLSVPQPSATAPFPPANPAAASPTAVASSPVSASELLALTEAPQFDGLPLQTVSNDLFATAGKCVSCHNKMTATDGKDVSIERMWRATLMANSARDPYWIATVRSEVMEAAELSQAADLSAVIEDTCATCHMPMAATTAHAAGEKTAILDGGLLDPQNVGHALAIEGVSCNLCHQIQAENFGQPESFSGGYLIDLQRAPEKRISYGPFLVDDALALAMQSASGFLPVQSNHLGQSEMCATCHTLYTPSLDASGKVVGQFPEQVPYPEWLNSSYKGRTSCQECHMPKVRGGVQISIFPGPTRSPFSQHSFVGGNTYMLQVFQFFGQELAATASSQHFYDAIRLTKDLLQENTAELWVDNLRVESGKLLGQVSVKNLGGHKFPTSYPSRRAWLHVMVKDANDQVVFESGASLPEGMIEGNDNDADPAAFEPHYLELNAPGQVQIYEAIMVDSDGQVTTRLLRGVTYAKDNRLLPAGFDKATAGPDIAVMGGARDDADFLGGQDTLNLALDLEDRQGPFTLSVELLFQSISYRWAQNLSFFQADEVSAFLRYYRALPDLPVVIATTEAFVP